MQVLNKNVAVKGVAYAKATPFYCMSGMGLLIAIPFMNKLYIVELTI